MAAIVFPKGEPLSIPYREFCFFPLGNPIGQMMTVHETRRARLQQLAEMKGGMANLCEALGLARSDTARFTRITNANVRHERGATPYVMGDDLARNIEETLRLERGWMDTPPGLELASDGPRLQALHRVAAELAPYQVDQLIQIGETLARGPQSQPAKPQLPSDLSTTGTAAHNAHAVSGAGRVPTLVKTAADGKGDVFDPSLKKPHDGAVDEGRKNRRSTRKRDGQRN
jgi:hypothetical protein